MAHGKLQASTVTPRDALLFAVPVCCSSQPLVLLPEDMDPLVLAWRDSWAQNINRVTCTRTQVQLMQAGLLTEEVAVLQLRCRPCTPCHLFLHSH